MKWTRLVSAILAVTLLTGNFIFPTHATENEAEPASTDVQDSTNNNGTGISYGNPLVAVARAELDAYTNGTGGSKYWAAYANYTGIQYSSDTPWCAAFVYYCAYECGYLTPDGDGCFGSTWQISCRRVWNDFYGKEILYTGSDYIPVAGDLVIYGLESSNPAVPANTEHIGIVEYVSPEGNLTTIEGNAGNGILARCTYSNYRVGSYAFEGNCIIGYIHPSYPEMIPDGPLYSYISGLMRPNDYARIICSGQYSTIMAGQVRMVGNDLYEFILAIPTLDKELGQSESVQALIAEVKSTGEGKLLRIVSAWNKAVKEHGDDLIALQTRYAADAHISPVHQTAYSRTGFDWMKTDIRREVLWEVATCTANEDAAGLILASFASGLTNDATDAEIIAAYNSWLPFVTAAFRFDLWNGYDHDTVTFWIDNLNDFGQVLEYLNTELNPVEEAEKVQ